MAYQLELSPALEQYWDKLESSIKPYIVIRAEKNDHLVLWQS